MSERSKQINQPIFETMSGLKEPTKAVVFPELADALSGEKSDAEALRDSASALLDRNGIKSHINGMPAMVTESYSAQIIDNKTYQVRIGRKLDKDDDRLLILFDVDEDIEVNTPNPYALFFKSFGDGVSLVTNNEINGQIDPLVSDERYLGLVKDIVEEIREKVEQSEADSAQAKLDRRRRLHPAAIINKYFNDSSPTTDGIVFPYKDLGEKRRTRIWKAGLVALAYCHLPLGSTDAKIGPLPLPVPIEFIVDWSNHADHVAQGFDQPEGARQLTIGDSIVAVPLLPEYSTDGAPDASYTSQVSMRTTEESRPGLYEVDFSFDYGPDTESCTVVDGDFTTGKSSIFTQTAELDNKITVTVEDKDTLRICPNEKFTNGSVYIYQSK